MINHYTGISNNLIDKYVGIWEYNHDTIWMYVCSGNWGDTSKSVAIQSLGNEA